MKIKYDPQVDALNIYFKKGPTEVTTMCFSGDLAIDLGSHEEIVGIEILGASDYLAIERLNPKVLLEILKPA